MKIKEILKPLGYTIHQDIEINRLSTFHQDVDENTLFLALKGKNFDANTILKPDFLDKVGFVLATEDIKNDKVLYIEDINYYQSFLVKQLYPNLFANVKVIGIVGTCGKSTTAQIVFQSLQKLGHFPFLSGTGKMQYEDKIYETNNTTLPAIEFVNDYQKITKDKKVDYLILEVSSHAILERRVAFLDFDYLIYTNLGQDHLDYHLNMNNYFAVKRSLFSNLNENATAIINRNDKYAKQVMSACRCKIFTYTDENILNLQHYVFSYNLYNFNAVYLLLRCEKFEKEQIIATFHNFQFYDGRSQMFSYHKGKIIVDYAHSVNAFQAVIQETKKICLGRLIIVFGCGGQRDQKKRPIMGKIAKQYGDSIILCDDNPRNESEEEIIMDILAGCPGAIIIKNRKKAIAFALNLLKENDILLVLGRGNEKYQLIKNQKIPCNDIEMIKEFLQNE